MVPLYCNHFFATQIVTVPARSATHILMNSFRDSNSVPVEVGGNSLSTAISIHDSSNDSPHNDGPIRFKVHLYDDYKEQATFPELESIGGTDRWVTINTLYNRSYAVEMVDDGAGFLLQRGWPILVSIENLQQGQTLMFQQEDEDVFTFWIHRPLQHPPPIGFSPARMAFPSNNFGPNQLIIDSGTKMNETVLQAIRQLWMASSVNGPIYVCCPVITSLGNNTLIFHQSYSDLIPKNKTNVAMRFLGSNIIIPGGIKTYNNGNTRMVKCSLYAKQHGLVPGETFICKIHDGPSVTEFIGGCAGRN